MREQTWTREQAQRAAEWARQSGLVCWPECGLYGGWFVRVQVGGCRPDDGAWTLDDLREMIQHG